MPRLATRAAAEIGMRNSLWRRHLGTRAARPSEADFETLARETCRLNRPVECVTVHARWLRDYPGSARLASSLAKGRNMGGATTNLLNSVLVDDLSTLFRPGGAALQSAEADLAVAATQMTVLFSSYYLHALPFDRNVLAAEWGRCESRHRPIEACLDGRAMAERQLGSLDAPRDQRGG